MADLIFLMEPASGTAGLSIPAGSLCTRIYSQIAITNIGRDKQKWNKPTDGRTDQINYVVLELTAERSTECHAGLDECKEQILIKVLSVCIYRVYFARLADPCNHER